MLCAEFTHIETTFVAALDEVNYKIRYRMAVPPDIPGTLHAQLAMTSLLLHADRTTTRGL